MTTTSALVTGASDGIGLEFCRVLAERGYNLVLVARREEKLRAAAQRLFHSPGSGAQEQVMMVNIVTLTNLTHLFGNDMETRGTGRILNVASTAAWIPIPNQNVYAASKSYVLAFTLALADELSAAHSPVSVCALCPGYAATKMLDNPSQESKLKVPASMTQSAADVASKGIEACLSGKSCYIPGIGN